MIYDLIAYVDHTRIAPLCDTLLAHANTICLQIITSGTVSYPAGDQFAGFSVMQTNSAAPAADFFNRAAKNGNAPYLIFLSAVSAVSSGFFEALDAAIATHTNFAGLAARVFPNEAEHHIDPVTLESPTLGDHACLVRRDAFEKAGGLDAAFDARHMWDELSLRLRAQDNPIFYTPAASVTTHSSCNAENGTRDDYLSDRIGQYLMALKYGDSKQILRARHVYLAAIHTPTPFPHVRRLLLQGYKNSFARHGKCKRWRKGNAALFQAVRHLPENGMQLCRGTEPLAAPVTDGPTISVVIRTHNRLLQLRGAVQSVANQTYRHYEIVIIEDGPPAAEKMLAAEFSHLPIHYHATGCHVGRSRAGNLGLQMATGDYLNFLDDDDYFYPDHLEQMAAKIKAYPDADLLLGCSVSMCTDGDSSLPQTRQAAAYSLVRFDRLDVFTMSQMCQIPLLSAVFKKQLFQRCGGLHEGMDAHEDWAMWLKYLAKAKRAHPSHIDIPRATSVFLQPASKKEADLRLAAYQKFDETLFNDPDIRFDVSLADMRRFYDGMLADILHVKQFGQLDDYLARETSRDEPKQG